MLPTKPSAQRRPDLDTLFSVNPDGSHNVIHTADVHGRFQVRKGVFWTLLLLVYIAFPWLEIGGHPAVLIDIQRRHFFLFGKTFNAQDFPLAFFYLSGIGFTLIVLSALYGRVWCGYACPQTVFLEGLFRRIERWIEGSSTQRKRLAEMPWNANKILRRGAKLVAFFVLSALIAHTFLSYFIPVAELRLAVTSSPKEHPFAFAFTAVFTGVVFVNFAWFREQLCLIICPYGRLQGVLADQDTVNVGYDAKRGEPRGRGASGDCVDCGRCVAVCPTGIDIRNGAQFECIGCANCIDACDDVMRKVGKPEGLVRYDSLRGFESGARRFVRPRLFVYLGLLCVGLAVFAVMASRRASFEANLLRAPTPYVLREGRVENLVSLHVFNKSSEPKVFTIEGRAPQGAQFVVAPSRLELTGLGEQRLTVIVSLPEADCRPGLAIEIAVKADAEEKVARLPFLGPAGGR